MEFGMEKKYGEIGMDVNSGMNEYFERALKPPSLKQETKNWSTLAGYVYMLSKEFNPFSDHKNKKLNKPLHLVKIGMGSLRSQSGSDKGLNRVFSLRTGTISLFINTLWLFQVDQADTSKRKTDHMEAYRAEQMLHSIIMDEWKPKPEIFRIHFRRGHTDSSQQGNTTEWFHVPKDRLEEFCNFCHLKMFTEVSPRPRHATGFSRNNYYEIQMANQPLLPIGVYYDKKTGKHKQKDEARLVNRRSDRLARNAKQRDQLARQLVKKVVEHQERLDSKAENWDGKKFDKKWENIFVGKRFKDAEMWGNQKDKYPDKIFTDVFRTDQFRDKLLIGYEPYFAKTRSQRDKKEELKDTREYKGSEGFLTVNEALDQLFKTASASFKKKFQSKYDYYVNKHGWQKNINYAGESI